MTITLRNAETGINEGVFTNVKHFMVCSTGAHLNGRTLIISRRYDMDDSFNVELLPNQFVCVKE